MKYVKKLLKLILNILAWLIAIAGLNLLGLALIAIIEKKLGYTAFLTFIGIVLTVIGISYLAQLNRALPPFNKITSLFDKGERD
ncbi:MAG: hypothetical protein V1767_00545 [Chloroflexota bacterium]